MTQSENWFILLGKGTVSNSHYQIQYPRTTFSSNREIDKITSFILVEKNEQKLLSVVIGWNYT